MNHAKSTIVLICILISCSICLYGKPPSGLMSVKMNGENLYIAGKISPGQDITIWFKKCMFNELYTFYRIGLVRNNSEMPTPFPERSETDLNVASSDNIGPLATEGGWCGGNHSFREKGIIRTAANISFSVFADGKKVNDKDSLYARHIEIRVINHIFNPTRPEKNANGEIIALKEVLCEENVLYRIKDGNIEVELQHTFSNEKPVTIQTYYGMQSMFSGEKEILTPGGPYLTFTAESEVAKFDKKDYPAFNRFIEKKPAAYQSTYLIPSIGLGDHSGLTSENDFIFTRGYGKCYHHLISNLNCVKGHSYQWSGLYTWFVSPLKDDDEMLIYEGKLHKRNLIFIDVKKASADTSFFLPDKYKGRAFAILQKDNGIRINHHDKKKGKINIQSENAGSVILQFRQIE